MRPRPGLGNSVPYRGFKLQSDWPWLRSVILQSPHRAFYFMLVGRVCVCHMRRPLQPANLLATHRHYLSRPCVLCPVAFIPCAVMRSWSSNRCAIASWNPLHVSSHVSVKKEAARSLLSLRSIQPNITPLILKKGQRGKKRYLIAPPPRINTSKRPPFSTPGPRQNTLRAKTPNQ